MVGVIDNREWVDYYEGQSIDGEYATVAYTTARGKHVEVPVGNDIEFQIAEIYRTCGRGTPIRLYLKEGV